MPPDEKQIATMRLNFGAFQDLISYIAIADFKSF